MTNYEHYRDEIEKIVRLGYEIAVDKNDNKPCACDNLSCDFCIASTDTCFKIISKWADAEYIESEVDWAKVKVDTPVLVKEYSNGNWVRRYFAKYQNGCVYTFGNGTTSWSSNNEGTISWKFAKLAEVEK